MKKLVSLILTLGLLVSIFSTFNTTASAKESVETGFYLNHTLHTKLVDFTKMSKKMKREVINDILKSTESSQLVMGGLVYDFGKVIQLPADVEPTGTPVENYDKDFIVPPTSPSVFRVINID